MFWLLFLRDCVACRTLFGLLDICVVAAFVVAIVVVTGYMTGGLMSSMRFAFPFFLPLRGGTQQDGSKFLKFNSFSTKNTK